MSKAVIKERVTNIQISVSTKIKLEELKDHGDTYNHVIQKLLEVYQKKNKKNVNQIKANEIEFHEVLYDKLNSLNYPIKSVEVQSGRYYPFASTVTVFKDGLKKLEMEHIKENIKDEVHDFLGKSVHTRVNFRWRMDEEKLQAMQANKGVAKKASN